MRGRLVNRDLAESSRGVPRGIAIARRLAFYDGSDWAWEFLRRNPDYSADWRHSVPRNVPHLALKDGTRLLRLRRRFPRAERWGLYAFADPSVAARQAPVFWHMAALKHVVRVRAAAPALENLTPLTLSSFNADRTAAIGVDTAPLVLMKGPGVHIALEIHDLAVLTNPFAPVFEIDGFADLNAQTELLKRLHRLAEQAPSAASRPALAIDERLHHALIALDESLGGKTYRQIAIAIFGEKKVAEEWQGTSQFLKDRTRRLVAKGTELMKGGYRDLLV
jgi:hypothetical protein